MIDRVQAQLERIYGLELPVRIDEFLIDRDTCRRLTGDRAGSGALVVRDAEDDVQVGVYIGQDALSDWTGEGSLTAENFAAFCTVTEEVSHFAYFMWNAHRGRTVTQLELELQAEVDKFVTSLLLLARQNRGLVPKAFFDRLFSDCDLRDGLDASQAERYRAASAFARAYCFVLVRRYVRPARLRELLSELRRFYRLSQREKIGHIYWMVFAS